MIVLVGNFQSCDQGVRQLQIQKFGKTVLDSTDLTYEEALPNRNKKKDGKKSNLIGGFRVRQARLKQESYDTRNFLISNSFALKFAQFRVIMLSCSVR